MTTSLPRSYSTLTPFRDAFLTGLPILMYHKIARWPRGVRTRGIYLKPQIFRQQMTELHEAGFRTAALDRVVGGVSSNEKKEFLVTFDDGYSNVFENALPVLTKLRLQAMQFLVPTQIGKRNEWDVLQGEVPESLMDDVQIREWLAAGQFIGAHTLTHPRLTQIPPAEAREEISGSKKALEDRFGIPISHFCYPYGDWNKSIREFVAEAGFLTACTTRIGIVKSHHPLSLPRIHTRYPSRNLLNFLRRILGGK